jgi:hypothetical protein
MRLRRKHTGELITLGEELEKKEDGIVYRVQDNASIVAKVYARAFRNDRLEKLSFMFRNSPESLETPPMQSLVAWPMDLLELPARQETFAGFLLPYVEGRSLAEVFNPIQHRLALPLLNYSSRLRTARSLAAAVDSLHAGGYVSGSLSDSSALMTEQELITLVDLDSVQVWDPDAQKLHACRPGQQEYMPPEALWNGASGRLPFSHDLFALAVLIFQLLIDGVHPFTGRFVGAGEDPSLQKRIRGGLFPYCRSRRVPVSPLNGAQTFSSIHPKLQDLFVRCFELGHFDPDTRPSAREWIQSFDIAEPGLAEDAVSAENSHRPPQVNSAEPSETAPPENKPGLLRGFPAWFPRLSLLVAAMLVAVPIGGAVFLWKHFNRISIAEPIPRNSEEALLWSVDDWVYKDLKTKYGEQVASVFRNEVHSRKITYSLPVDAQDFTELFIFRNDSILGRVNLDHSSHRPDSLELAEYSFQVKFVSNLLPASLPTNYARPQPPDKQLPAKAIENYMKDLFVMRGVPAQMIEGFSRDVAERTTLFVTRNDGTDIIYRKSYVLGTLRMGENGSPSTFSLAWGTLWPYEYMN